jgi:hypothetical protein
MADHDSPSRLEEIESRFLSLGLVIAIAVSLADSVLNFLDDQRWVFPLVFLALLIQLRWLDTTRRKVLSITSGATLRTYESHAEFYAAALQAVSRSSRSVYAVFSHATPPSLHTEDSRKYYTGTIRWARRDPGHRLLHRVIRLPASSPDIQQWVDEQIGLANRIENYRVRVLRYPPGIELEGENFAVIDSSIVFLGFAMDEREELKGFSIRDARVASAFEEHFKELWRISKAPADLSGA